MKHGLPRSDCTVVMSVIIRHHHRRGGVDVPLYCVPGSFKVRGVLQQLAGLAAGDGPPHPRLLTMSAGNYGKAFAVLTSRLGLQGLVVMPDTTPSNRAQLIRVGVGSSASGKSNIIHFVYKSNFCNTKITFLEKITFVSEKIQCCLQNNFCLRQNYVLPTKCIFVRHP